MSKLFSSRGGRFFLGVIAGAATLVFLLLPASESFSYDGYTDYGGAEVKCGSVLNEKVVADFDDSDAQDYWDNYSYFTDYYAPPEEDLYIFEGKNASEVCEKKLSSNRNIAIGAGVVGGVLLISSLVGGSKGGSGATLGTPYGGTPPSSPHAPPLPTPTPASRPTLQAASAGQQSTSQSEARWHPDPQGRHQFRYWNGRKWTSQVSDNGIVSDDPVN